MCKWKSKREKGHKLIKAFLFVQKIPEACHSPRKYFKNSPSFHTLVGLRGFCASNYNIEC